MRGRLRVPLLTAAFLLWAGGVGLAAHVALAARFQALALHAPRVMIVLVVLLAAWWAGGALGRAAAVEAGSALDAIPRLAGGLAVLSYGWLLLALVGLLQVWLAWLLLGVGAVGGTLAALRGDRPCVSRAGAAPRGVLLPALLVVVGLASTLPMALTPPVSTDALVYHLTLPKWYAEAGGFVALPRFALAAFPAQMEMLYAWMLLLGQPSAAKLLHFVVGLAAAGLAGAAAARWGSPWSGWAAAAVLLTTPVFLLNMSWAWLDAALGLFVLAGTLELLGLAEDPRPGKAVRAGLFWGMALGLKYTAPLYLVAALVVCLWPRPRRSPRRLVASALVVVAVAGALVAPYLVRNAVIYGNPTHPLAGALWAHRDEAPYDHVLDAVERRSQPRDFVRGVVSYALWPAWFDDNPGLLYLLALPVLAFVPLAAGARRLYVVGALCMLGLSVAFGGSVRYQIPAFCLLAVPMGCWLGGWWQAGGARRWGAGGLLVVAALSNLTLLALHNRQMFDPVPVALGHESPDAYLSRIQPTHRALLYLNRHAPLNAMVLALGEERLLYLDRAVVASSVLDVSPARDWAREAASTGALAARLRQEGVGFVLLNRSVFEARVKTGVQAPYWSARDLEVLEGCLAESELVLREGGVEVYRLRRE